jgi:DNA-directed RNA polymerase III subunit RPC3
MNNQATSDEKTKSNFVCFCRRLLDKHQRVEAIATTLEQSGADPAQREEIEEMITPAEKTQLQKVKHMTHQ